MIGRLDASSDLQIHLELRLHGLRRARTQIAQLDAMRHLLRQLATLAGAGDQFALVDLTSLARSLASRIFANLLAAS